MRITGILLPLLLAVAGKMPGQGIITTLAGTQFTSCGPLGDGGPATSAQLCGAQSPATDSSGNIYFFDYGNARIRKITPDGVITTIAGNGVHGTAGDGGPALSANLGSIGQMAWSSAVMASSASAQTTTPMTSGAGYLCFGDSQAYKIRCVALDTGMIQGYGTGTPGYAGDGGNVAKATFNDLQGAAFDTTGNFYVSDFASNVVRRVDAVTGIVTTLAGPGPGYCCAPLGDGGAAAGANLYEPWGLAFANGGLYISDQGNERVRRVDLATGIINTVAGNGSPYQSGDGGPAISAGLSPRWLAVDSTGNLFIDTGVVVKVNTSGIINTVAGTPGIDGYGYDDIPATQTVTGGIEGLGFDTVANRLLISDTGDRIRQVFYTPSTETNLTATPNPAVPGQQIMLQAMVLPVDATGNVRFHNGNAVLGSAPITNGIATFMWTPAGSSTYTLYAVYGGDPTHNLSSSDTVTLTVQMASTTTALSSNQNPSNQGQAVTFTATVNPSAATGSVTFKNAGNSMGIGTLSGGVATFTISTLAVGSNSITASYNGSSGYFGSSSPPLTQVIKAVTTTTLTSSPNPSAFGAVVALTATVVPSTATGAVQFFNGGTLLGSATLASGKAQLNVSTLPAGTDSLTATYMGDASNASSASNSRIQSVNKASSTTTLTASPGSQSNSGQIVTLIATVTPSAATGTVQFLDGSTLLGTSALNNGTATFSTSSLSIGNHSIKANYGGDGNVNASLSSTISYKVKH